ncbi:MAG: Mrp/NBP35 family ATP-binding protein [Pseudomonadota bacterium]
MFRSKPKSSQAIEASIREALGTPDWLQTVTVTPEGRAVLVIQANPGEMERFEALRIEAESAARGVKGVNDVNAILTSERTPGDTPPAPSSRQDISDTPSPATRRVRKGARLSDEALAQGDAGSAPAAIPPVEGAKRILVVASAKGGVGKSTVAVNLAAALSKVGMKVGLLDADIYGPSIPTMLGTEDAQPSTTAEGRLEPVQVQGLQTLSIGYLSDADAPMIWRGPIVMSAINQMLREASWGDPGDPLDILIIDTPPGTGDAQLALAQRVPVDAAVIVTTPQDVALADVRRGAAMFAKTHVPVLGIVETMSWFEDPSGERHYLMGEGGGARMAQSLGLPLLAQIPLIQAIREGGDSGIPAAYSHDAAGHIFHALARETALALDALQTKPAPEIVFED